MSISSLRKATLSVLLVGALSWLWSEHNPRQLRRLVTPTARAEARILIIMDTVRADHLSICGGASAASPTLAQLAAEGAAYSCEAIAPGAWTLPSHASFFTGTPVTEHGAHFAPEDEGGAQRTLQLRGLDPSYVTLAEELQAQGYQTVSVSGNPLISEDSGLSQGFDVVIHDSVFGPLSGDALTTALEDVLLELDPDRPAFLFVNIADAHAPWAAVPEGLGWLPPRPAMMHSFADFWELTPEEAAEDLAHRADVYAYAVHRADRTLGQVLGVMRQRGWLTPETPMVITSDHGEFLGEHGLVGHGRYIWAPNQQVLMMTHGISHPELPSPVSALVAWDLIRDGHLAERPVEAVAYPDRNVRKLSEGRFGQHTWAGRWHADGTKTFWRDGSVYRVGPDDQIQGPGRHERLEGLPEQVEASALRHRTTDLALLRRLEAMGYIANPSYAP